jgi:hypothetical protein
MNHARSKFSQIVSTGIFALCVLLCVVSAVQAQPAAPVIREAKLVTGSFIELDWEGTNYINNAGRSKENTSATHNNFEVMLNGTRLNLNSSVPSWYWNITNYQLHGVRVNQNKTTLRLASSLSNAQMTALQNGTSTMTVRITGNVTASAINLTSTPNGAIAASAIGAPGPAANTTTVYPIVYKPYYDKTVVSKTGVPVRGSEFVLQRTVQQAADMVDVILSVMPEDVLTNVRNRNQFVIFGPGEHSYNIPEHRSIFLTDNWNRAEGYGGTTSATSAANVERHHNIPAAQRPYASAYASGYRDESILAHEFGHGVHGAMPTAMRNELTAIFNSARATPENPANPTGRQKWDNSYAGSNASEYMATVTATWFDAMRETANWGGTYGPLNYREELRRYDTPFYNFLTRIYPETRTLSTAWGSGVPNTSAPFFAPEPAEPAGKYGPSIKIKATTATNSAGSGLNAYIPFNAAANTTPNVELWWDGNTNLMRWYLEPDDDESYFRIRKKIERNDTQNSQNGNLVLMPTGSGTTAGTRIVLNAVNNSNESQWWNLRRQTDGSFVIINKSNPQIALALENNETASGTRIVLAALNSTSRFWRITDGDVPLEQRITAAAAQTGITVSRGTPPDQLGLPATVSVSINSIRNNVNNTPVYGTMSKNVPVTWNTAAYNSNTPGTYTISGTLQLDGLLTNPNNHNASVTVVVEGASTVAADDRALPQDNSVESAAVIPAGILAAEFTAGPNPVARSSGAVNFYRQGEYIDNGTLTIYDAHGNTVNRIRVSDTAPAAPSRRVIGTWNLTDAGGRPVPAGTYLVRGAIIVSGKRERVSAMVGVR